MSEQSLHDSAVALLAGWSVPDIATDAIRHTMLAFLAARSDACLRSCVPGHLTASTLVLDHTRTHALLTLHPRVGSWIQLGGHCEEPDATIAAAAHREAIEESGISRLTMSANPVALHTHPITCSLGVPTRHLDVRFVAVTEPTEDGSVPDVVCSDESVDLRWWPVDALPADECAPEMAALVMAALRATEPG